MMRLEVGEPLTREAERSQAAFFWGMSAISFSNLGLETSLVPTTSDNLSTVQRSSGQTNKTSSKIDQILTETSPQFTSFRMFHVTSFSENAPTNGC